MDAGLTKSPVILICGLNGMVTLSIISKCFRSFQSLRVHLPPAFIWEKYDVFFSVNDPFAGSVTYLLPIPVLSTTNFDELLNLTTIYYFLSMKKAENTNGQKVK